MTAWRSTIAVGAVLTAAYFAMPNEDWQDTTYMAMGLASVVCMIVGVRMNHPAQRWAWLAMAASNLCFVGGDAVLSFYGAVLHRDVPFPSISDASYLLGMAHHVDQRGRVLRSSRPSPTRQAKLMPS